MLIRPIVALRSLTTFSRLRTFTELPYSSAKMSSEPVGPPMAALQEESSAPNNHSPDPELKPSKNALKRMRRQQEWEDGRDDRRKRRKEKRVDRRSRKREEKASLVAQGLDPSVLDAPRKRPSTLVPIALIVDCDFEKYMNDKEIISLSSQVTRCYSENKQARWRSHLYVAGFKGKLSNRYRDVFQDVQKSWKGVCFEEGGFESCIALAKEKMGDKAEAGVMIPALESKIQPGEEGTGQHRKGSDDDGSKKDNSKEEGDPSPVAEPEPEPVEALRNVVYLTSDSPHTLQRLEPNTSYIIGGIVDKNREKGLCYKRARETGVRTAKLPIGDFMKMQVRHVLATNHVVEIMLKWLEYEDWGKAFMEVIPARKKGILKGDAEDEEAANVQTGGEEEGAEEQEGVEGEEGIVRPTDEKIQESVPPLEGEAQDSKKE